MIDVFDRVLDKGIVIDAVVRVAFAGIDLITVDARVLVASFDTYLQHAQAVKRMAGFVDSYQLKSVDDTGKAISSSERGAKDGQWVVPRKRGSSRRQSR